MTAGKIKVLDNGEQLSEDMFGRIYGAGVRDGKVMAVGPRVIKMRLQGEKVEIDCNSIDRLKKILRILDKDRADALKEAAIVRVANTALLQRAQMAEKSLLAVQQGQAKPRVRVKAGRVA